MRIFRRIRELEKGEGLQLLEKYIWTFKARIHTRLPIRERSFFLRKSEREEARKGKRKFFFENDEINRTGERYQDRFEGMRQGIIRKADKICRREYDFLNVKFSFEKEIDWHWDPSKKKRWPKAFFPDIVYAGDQEVGDIKIAWELSRHQHLVTLGLAYCLSKKESYAKEIVGNIDHWIDENRPYLGIHWISALEVGIRLISWTWCYHLIKDSSEVQASFLKKFMKAIRIQTDYIEKNLSIGKYAGNHLVGEAAALAMVGMYFNEWKSSKRWVKKGLAVLEEEVTKQIHPDGGGAEQATSYLRFIIEFFLQRSCWPKRIIFPFRLRPSNELRKRLSF